MTAHAILSVVTILIVFAVCGSLLGFQWITGVPPLSSNAAEAADIAALLRQAGLPEDAVIYELGSGWGSLAIRLARAFPAAQIRGIELSPLPCFVARLRARKIANLRLYRRNLYDCDLTDAQAVTCYMMAGPMPKIAQFLDRVIVPGTPVVTLSFWFRDRQPTATLDNAGKLGAAALYRWPALRS